MILVHLQVLAIPVGSGEVWGGVWESAWGEREVCWHEGEGCKERNGGGVGKCVKVWGSNTSPQLLSHLSSHLPHPNPLSYTSSHTSSHISLSYPHRPHPNTLSYTATPIPTSPSPSQSVAKFLWQSYHVAKVLATITTGLTALGTSKFHKAAILLNP